MLKSIANSLACAGVWVLLLASPLASASTKKQNHDRMGQILGEIEALKPNRKADPAVTARFNALQSELRTLQASLGGDLPCATGEAIPGTPGVEGVAVAVPAGCTPTPATFTNNTPVTVPTGPAVVTSTINVSGAGVYLWDLNVRTALTHSFPADLDVTIQSPAGTVVTLTTDNGAGNGNVFDGTLWDDSANPSGQVPYTSNNGLVTDHPYVDLTLASPLVPEEALSAFIGENPNGTWTITISDDLAGDGGSLNSWSLEMVTFAAPVIAAPAQTFTQTTAVAIPTGPAVVSSDLAVSGLTQRICSMRLRTDLVHTFGADIDATLTSPAGTVVTLTTDNGTGSDNVFDGTIWDDDANPAGQAPYITNDGIATDHAYFNLTLASPLVVEESFGAFLGEEGNGTWTLTISDDLSGDAGSLDQWSLEFVTCTCNTPPTIAYDPTTGSNVAFTGVTTIGTVGNGSIVVTPSGGSGSGAAATTTINTCTLGGASPSAFAGAAAINLSFVGDTTTPQNLALTCTSQQTVQTATLTCNETRGTAAPVQRQWNLTCPAGTPVAPTIAYNPTTGSNVAFTGVTTIGTTGNATIAATPSGGIGTGAGATTTINTCTLGGASPGAFAGAAAINLSFVGNTTTPQNLALTCTSQQTAQTATLTCLETRGVVLPPQVSGIAPNPAQRQWNLTCPAGTPVAPTIAYNPTTGSNVAFTGVTTIGTTGNATIAATPSGGIGTGAGATTTINTCTLGGTNPGSFAGAAAINLSFVGDTTTPQNLALTCTSQQTATLTCNETRGTAAPVQRQWTLNCPAGTPVAPTIAYNPTTGSNVAFTGVTTIGTTGNATIAATPSGGIGTGAGATTTINTCTLGGTNPGSFAGAAAINLSFVGNTTTPQNLALTCTSQQTAQTATLTCNETRGTAAPVQRQWNLTCPAGTPVAPTIAYNPATGSNVAFTGVTTIGTTGNGSIAATPSGGIGTGAGATTTINTCTLGGANPGSFAGAAAINLSFVGNTTTPQNLALTCTSAATAQTATLTCNETRGTAAPVQRQWPLNCPAGALLPLTSAPVSGSTVNLTGVSGGNTGTSTVTITNPNPIAVSLTCTAPAFPFTATPLAFSIPSSGNTPVTVGISPAAPGNYTGSLTCNVTGSSQVLTFSLAGTLVAPITVTATSTWSLLALMLALLGFALVAVRRQG